MLGQPRLKLRGVAAHSHVAGVDEGVHPLEVAAQVAEVLHLGRVDEPADQLVFQTDDDAQTCAL
jgi:hypothetical protein